MRGKGGSGEDSLAVVQERNDGGLELSDGSRVRNSRIWDILEVEPRVTGFADVGMKGGVLKVIQLGHPLLIMPISHASAL